MEIIDTFAPTDIYQLYTRKTRDNIRIRHPYRHPYNTQKKQQRKLQISKDRNSTYLLFLFSNDKATKVQNKNRNNNNKNPQHSHTHITPPCPQSGQRLEALSPGFTWREQRQLCWSGWASPGARGAQGFLASQVWVHTLVTCFCENDQWTPNKAAEGATSVFKGGKTS